MFKNYRIRDYDFKLILMLVALSAIGVMAIGSAEESLQTRQLAGVAAGIAAMIVISFCNYSVILRLNWLMYFGNIALPIRISICQRRPAVAGNRGDFAFSRRKLRKFY